MSGQRSATSRLLLVVATTAVSLGLTAMIPGSGAMACGGIFDVACNVTHGGLSPQNLGRETGRIVGNAANDARNGVQAVANALNELQASVLSGPTLERAIIESHNTAINGAMPIPPQIRAQLTGYASEDSMNRVRFKVGDNGFANLAHLIEQGGAADAVTLIDVVVFRGPGEASNPAIWAHELVHVDQYRDWGVHSFAVQYARNYRSVEDPAYAKGDGFWNWQQQQGQQGPQAGIPGSPFAGVPVPGIPVGFPPGFGQFCLISLGRFGPGPAQPIGNQCFVGLPQGNFVGQIVP